MLHKTAQYDRKVLIWKEGKTSLVLGIFLFTGALIALGLNQNIQGLKFAVFLFTDSLGCFLWKSRLTIDLHSRQVSRNIGISPFIYKRTTDLDRFSRVVYWTMTRRRDNQTNTINRVELRGDNGTFRICRTRLFRDATFLAQEVSRFVELPSEDISKTDSHAPKTVAKTVERVPCLICERMMLPDTAKRNNGICMLCKRKGRKT
jgi:hypothetical protein